jgi:hypothetical protein
VRGIGELAAEAKNGKAITATKLIERMVADSF